MDVQILPLSVIKKLFFLKVNSSASSKAHQINIFTKLDTPVRWKLLPARSVGFLTPLSHQTLRTLHIHMAAAHEPEENREQSAV